MDLFVATESGQLQHLKFKQSSVLEKVDINFGLLACDDPSVPGTGFPKIQTLTQACGPRTWIVRSNGAIEAFDLNTKALTDDPVIFPFAKDTSIVCLLQEEEKLWAVGSDGKLVLVDAETGSVTATFTLLGPKKETILPVCAAYSDGMLALAGKGSRNNLCVYKLADAVEGVAELKPLLMAKDQFNEKLRLAIPVDCRAVCFAGKERVVVSTGTGAIDVYPIKASTKPVLPSFSKKILPKDSVVRGLYPCPESDAILISDGQGVLEAFDLAAGKPIGRFAGHEGAITAAISVRVNKRQLLISGSKDRFLRIFDFATRKLLFKQYMKYVPSSVMARLEPESASGAESNSDSETSSLWDEMQIAPESKKQRLN